jgi:hypothetical protein
MVGKSSLTLAEACQRLLEGQYRVRDQLAVILTEMPNSFRGFLPWGVEAPLFSLSFAAVAPFLT